MLEPDRHVPLRAEPWSATEAHAAIEEIVADALAHHDRDQFWPAHPLDEPWAAQEMNFYLGATGMVWALDYLSRAGATKARVDFRPVMARLIEASRIELATSSFQDYAAHASFLFGDFGAALVAMRVDPAPSLADTLHARADANTALPIRELMWGLPGSMLGCVHMAALTNESRWQALFEAQAARLLGDLEETDDGPLWKQDIYGTRLTLLGAVHGFAGNIIPLLHGWQWLTQDQRARVADASRRTLSRTARRGALGANWPPALGDTQSLCQHCHGAPGIVTTFAGAPFASPELDALLLDGGEFIWAAGPLAKGSCLCHGTAGNGYAFLKLYGRTGDAAWLDRARAFAMTAIAQAREARAHRGHGRYSLWTGDIGVAIYLWDCLGARPFFPTIDVF